MRGNVKYQLRLFSTAVLCIWAVILMFAWYLYRQEKDIRTESVIYRIALAAGNVISMHMDASDIQPYLNFVDGYFSETTLEEMCIQVVDTSTQKVIASTGMEITGIPSDAIGRQRQVLSDGSQVIRIVDTSIGNGDDRVKLFYYSSRISPDGEIDVRAYVPQSELISKAIAIHPEIWFVILTIGVVGTIMAFVITKHQAKNVELLHQFATSAAEDNDFIPMGDFPPDEIGDISRQIIAIYNSRMQANMRREREHQVALKAIEENTQMKRTLTDNISHELKTPVGIIRAYVDMLISQPDMPEKDRLHFLNKTQVNVERLVAMLNDLSTMTRLEETSGKIQLKEIDFFQLVYSIADEAVTSGWINDMTFKYDIPQDCIVLGNEGLLRSALQNLIKNSVAYSKGTELGIVMTGFNEGYYSFVYYDNGVGVAEEHLSHLFDRFYRVDSGRSRKSGGTGLGLPIVRSTINTMGGSVSVRLRKEGGLEFPFTLPRPKGV